MNWYKKAKIYETERMLKLAAYISRDELEERLEAIGWNLSNKNDGDYIAFGPPASGLILTMVSRHNWEKNWQKPKQHLRRQIGGGDLDFLFNDGNLKIPDNFNRATQRLITNQQSRNIEYNVNDIVFAKLPDFTKVAYEILIDGTWQKIKNIDYINKQILLTNDNIVSIPDFSTHMKIRTVR